MQRAADQAIGTFSSAHARPTAAARRWPSPLSGQARWLDARVGQKSPNPMWQPETRIYVAYTCGKYNLGSSWPKIWWEPLPHLRFLSDLNPQNGPFLKVNFSRVVVIFLTGIWSKKLPGAKFWVIYVICTQFHKKSYYLLFVSRRSQWAHLLIPLCVSQYNESIVENGVSKGLNW